MKKIIVIVLCAWFVGEFAFDATEGARTAIVKQHAVLASI